MYVLCQHFTHVYCLKVVMSEMSASINLRRKVRTGIRPFLIPLHLKAIEHILKIRTTFACSYLLSEGI